MIPKALFAGITTLDIHYFVGEYPAPNSKTKSSGFSFTTGGPATNAAATYAYLGGDSHLYTVVGRNHSFSDFIYNDLRKWNVVLYDLMPETDEIPTVASIITTGKTGERTVMYTRTSHNICPPDLIRRISRYQYDIILVDGMNMEACIKIAGYGKSKGIPVVLDGGSWKDGMQELLPLITIAICSDDFIPPGTNTIREIMEFLKMQNIELLALTRGKDPVLFLEKDKMDEIPVDPVEVVDTLGAGDVFHGSFCHYFIRTGNFSKSLQEAAKTASKSCRFKGARTWMSHEMIS